MAFVPLRAVFSPSPSIWDACAMPREHSGVMSDYPVTDTV